jgi:hypothetical protein
MITKFAFPLKRKRIFEIYDPWSTMVNSSRIKKLENKAFNSAKILIQPSAEPRIKVERKDCFSLSNTLDPSIALTLLEKASSNFDLIHKIKSLQPYILSGGTVNRDTRIGSLISAISSQQDFNLIITCAEDYILQTSSLELPNRTYCIGKVSWSDWLLLLHNSSAVWAYYSRENEHFRSHISPVKYWEACLFGTPLIVNELNQFSDRALREPEIYELGDPLALSIEQALNKISPVTLLKTSQNLVFDDYWYHLEKQRNETVKLILKQVGLKAL